MRGIRILTNKYLKSTGVFTMGLNTYFVNSSIDEETTFLQDSAYFCRMFNQEMTGMPTATCVNSIAAIHDALYVLNGKWKLPLLAALNEWGPLRFNELQKCIQNLTPKVLARELRELELNELIKRNELPGTPATITYELTAHSQSLNGVLKGLQYWGEEHRQRLVDSRRSNP